jgi:hypothetical protein
MPEEYRQRHRKARAGYLAAGKPDSLMEKTVEIPALRSGALPRQSRGLKTGKVFLRRS